MTRGLVLLHGFTGAPQSWEGVRGALRASPPILAPSLLGHGAEGEMAPDFEGEIERLADMVRRWGEPRPHLVGYSLGARIGLGLLASHADLFASATLIGVNPGLASPDERESRRKADGVWSARLRRDGIASFVESWEALPLFASQRALPAERRKTQRSLRLSHDAEGLALSLERLGLGVMPCFLESASRITVDVQLLAGGEDAKFLSLGSRLASTLPRGELDVVAGAGHNLPLERPDAVAAAIQRALGAGEKS